LIVIENKDDCYNIKNMILLYLRNNRCTNCNDKFLVVNMVVLIYLKHVILLEEEEKSVIC
jgi:hypothetical protein